MRVDTFCAASCMLAPLSAETVNQFASKIDDEYRVNMCGVPFCRQRQRLDTLLAPGSWTTCLWGWCACARTPRAL